MNIMLQNKIYRYFKLKNQQYVKITGNRNRSTDSAEGVFTHFHFSPLPFVLDRGEAVSKNASANIKGDCLQRAP